MQSPHKDLSTAPSNGITVVGTQVTIIMHMVTVHSHGSRCCIVARTCSIVVALHAPTSSSAVVYSATSAVYIPGADASIVDAHSALWYSMRACFIGSNVLP